MFAGTLASAAVGVGAGLAFDEAELELRGGLDDVLDAGRIVDAGKLDDDAVAALRCDVRLGDAEGVDAVVDRLDRVRRSCRARWPSCDAVFILNCIAPSGVRLTSNDAEVVLGDALVLGRSAMPAGGVAMNVVSFDAARRRDRAGCSSSPAPSASPTPDRSRGGRRRRRSRA